MSEIFNLDDQKNSQEQQELLELGRRLFNLVQEKLGDSKEIILDKEGDKAVVRPIEFKKNSGAKEAGIKGWYEAGSDTYNVYNDGTAERIEPTDYAMINLQIETLTDRKFEKANDSAKMNPLSKEEIKRLIERFEKIVKE